jgi:hypothetical protein
MRLVSQSNASRRRYRLLENGSEFKGDHENFTQHTMLWEVGEFGNEGIGWLKSGPQRNEHPGQDKCGATRSPLGG